MVLGMSLECTLLHNSYVVTNSDYVTNSNSIMDYCRTSVSNDRSRRLLQNHASCREGIAVLVCQPAVGIWSFIRAFKGDTIRAMLPT